MASGDRRAANGLPTEKTIRNQGAIPWASQIRNDSDYTNGTMLDDVLNQIQSVEEQVCEATALELQTLNDEVSAAIGGLSTDAWVPTIAIATITAITGAANGDAEITIGTASGGTQILAATALTATNAVGESFVIDLSGTVRASIAGNATLYVKCTTADTGAGTSLVATVRVYGKAL